MSNSMSVFRWLPCPVVFICTAHGDLRDIMTATAMFVSEKEPLLTVSVARGHLTDRLIRDSRMFTLAIASTQQKDLAIQLGSARGGEADKYARFAVATLPDGPAGFGVPQASAAWMHCRAEHQQEIPGYTVWIARVTDQKDLGRAPMVWQADAFFRLQGA